MAFQVHRDNHVPHGVGQNEIRSSLLFEESPDPVLLLDEDIFVDCNESALTCLGFPNKNQLIGMHPWDISPVRQPDGRLSLDKGREIIETTLLKGTDRFEWFHLASDGRELLMDVFLTVVRIRGRQILYTVWRDITVQKKAEDALRISELRLSEAMGLACIVHWELDPENETFLFNDPFYTLYATTALREGGYGMATEQYITRFVHPGDVGLFHDRGVKRRLDDSGCFSDEFEYRIIRRDGKIRHILTRIRAISDTIGHAKRCFGTNQDITERKQTENTLRESEERYRIAIEHSNDGVAIVRGKEHVFVNNRFLSIFGYDEPEQVLGAQLYVTVHPDDYERVMEINRESGKKGTNSLRYEFKGVRRDGTVCYVEVSSTRIIYQGKPATLAYLRDISERIQAEEMLRQSQKMEAIGTLSAGIAHDFNNVLAAILGFAELSYEEAPPDSRMKRYLLHVVNAAHRGKDLVTQILSFSRKRSEGFHPIAVAPVVKESIKMLRASLPKTIEIREDISTEPLSVFADPIQIQQIVMNLGMNAAHAMWKNGGLLTVRLASSTSTSETLPDLTPGSYAALRISDTGIGMEKDVLERIFDPFFTTKKRGEGTGLGLWVVQSIVKNHKGAIAMESIPGRGSTFEVLLPLEEEHRSLSKDAPLPDLAGCGHILIVDDETDIAEMEKIMVEKLGYSATVANDSGVALELFKENPDTYDLILTDQTMPGMTGIDLTRELLSIRHDVPVALITGYREEMGEEAARAAGVEIILPKPISRVELGTAIKNILRMHRSTLQG